MIEKKKHSFEKAVLVGIINDTQNEALSKEYLEELDFLTRTAGGEVVKIFTQKRQNINPKTYIGKGKTEEIHNFIKEHKVPLVIFDDELSPAQQKNLERIFECRVLDRTNLILDIFSQRAQTYYARTQVELAQCQYFLPRLTGLWTHLERQKGGIGMRGPGETEIETDRRILRKKISLLKKKLEAIDKQMSTQRGNRGDMVRVALVGYTNVGKSSLMNLLSKCEIEAENKLFHTLDTTVRKTVVDQVPFLLSDTVGFIRKLPTQLVESFKSTLDEVREADILLHVVDISHPSFEDHIKSVNTLLEELSVNQKPIIMVFNKTDAYTHETIDEDDLTTEFGKKHFTLKDWEKEWKKSEQKVCFISVKDSQNIDQLKQILGDQLQDIYQVRFPYHQF